MAISLLNIRPDPPNGKTEVIRLPKATEKAVIDDLLEQLRPFVKDDPRILCVGIKLEIKAIIAVPPPET